MPQSDIVRKLTERGRADTKVSTTIRLNADTFRRLDEQSRRWSTKMSFLIEEALQPVLRDLEAGDPDAEPPENER